MADEKKEIKAEEKKEKKKRWGVINEFQAFAIRGNLVDLAVGVVIGGAFAKVISSFVDGMIMPAIGRLLLNVDLAKYKWVLQVEQKDVTGKVIKPEVAIQFGNFVTQVIDFVIVAFAVFMVIKMMNRLRKTQEAAPPVPSREEVLLTEIRDLLKEQRKT